MRDDLFSHAERYPVPISSFALPSDISIFGNHFGDSSYYADLAGIAKKYRPWQILEIGVRFGYSGIAMCLGAIAGLKEDGYDDHSPSYVGIDACYFPHPADPHITSHDLAKKHLEQMVPDVSFELFHWDTRRGLPPTVLLRERSFDLVNVDGDHSFEGCYHDLVNIWPLVAPGGIVIVDDLGMEGVRRAVEQFRDERRAELAGIQIYPNERTLAIYEKVVS